MIEEHSSLTSAQSADALSEAMPAGSIQVTRQRPESFDINRIQVGRRTRVLNAERLEALVGSISTIGLRSPITVRIIPKMVVDGIEEDSVPLLVTGLHRLEAAKRLGMESIDCLIEPGSELDAQLWEIDENLCRAELSELERAEHLQSRKTIYEQIHPLSRQGGLPGAPGGGKVKTAKLAGFATDTAKQTGMPERSIRRAVRRATEIDPTVRDRIRDKPQIADSGVELDTLSGMSPTEQKRAIDIIEAGQAATVREAQKQLKQRAQAEGRDAEKLTRTVDVGAPAPTGAHVKQTTATIELIEMLLAWDRFDQFMALLKKTDISRLVQALKDHGERASTGTIDEPSVAARGRIRDAVDNVAEECVGATRLPELREGAGDMSFHSHVEKAATAPPDTGDLERSVSVSAEGLMEIFSGLKPNTQQRGLQWVIDGCPVEYPPDEHFIITENLLSFRAALSNADGIERKRFLDMTRLRTTCCVEETV